MPSIYALAVSCDKQEECLALWLCGQGAYFHTLWLWALRFGQQPVNLSTAKGLACKQDRFAHQPGWCTWQAGSTSHLAHSNSCCAAYRQRQHCGQFSAQHHLLASLTHSYFLPFTVLSVSCMCKDPVSCSPVLLPEDRLGNCTVKPDSVPIKQFDELQRLNRDGDRSA